jgi:hypothetical protein
VLSAAYGHVAESFSVTPLLGLAATLLTGRMPRLRGGGGGGALAEVSGVTAAKGSETADLVAAICTDYTGAVTGVRLAPMAAAEGV